MTSDTWLAHLDEKSLLNALPASMRQAIEVFQSSEMSFERVDEIGSLLDRAPYIGITAKGGRPSRSLWPDIKKEFIVFLCQEDERYKELKQRLNTESKIAERVIVSLISAEMAKNLDVHIGIITPFIVVLLLTVVRLGKEAICGRYIN